MQAEVSRRGLGYAWEAAHCPAVNAGPEKDVGHTGPTELETRRGELLHMDFGVEKDAYCSDLQRVWYLLDDGESEPPEMSSRRGTRSGPRWTRGPTCFVPESPGTRSTPRPAPASSRRATKNRSTRSATNSAVPPTTAAPCSARVGIGTATPSRPGRGGQRLHARVRRTGPRPRLHRARRGRARHDGRPRVAEHAPARALARRVAAW